MAYHAVLLSDHLIQRRHTSCTYQSVVIHPRSPPSSRHHLHHAAQPPLAQPTRMASTPTIQPPSSHHHHQHRTTSSSTLPAYQPCWHRALHTPRAHTPQHHNAFAPAQPLSLTHTHQPGSSHDAAVGARASLYLVARGCAWPAAAQCRASPLAAHMMLQKVDLLATLACTSGSATARASSSSLASS